MTAHPDKGGSGDAFKRVEQARAKLMDAEKRQKYIKTYPLRCLRTGLTGPLFDSEHARDEARAKWLQFTLQTPLNPLFVQLPAKGADTTCTPKNRRSGCSLSAWCVVPGVSLRGVIVP